MQQFNGAMKILLNKVLESMESEQVTPWSRPWVQSGPAMPINMATKRPYAMLNAMFLMAIGETNYWLSRTAIEKLGGEIVDDNPALVLSVFKKVQKGKFDKNGEPLKVFCRRFTKAYNLSQTSGIACPAVELPDNFSPIDSAQSVLDSMPNKPAFTVSETSDRAFYDLVEDSVTLPSEKKFKTSEGFYGVAFHELAHSTGHETRLDRDLRALGQDRHSYSFEELIAELSSAYLCAHCGIDRSDMVDNSAAYIKGWSKALKSNPMWLFEAATKAQKAVDYILGKEVKTDKK